MIDGINVLNITPAPITLNVLPDGLVFFDIFLAIIIWFFIVVILNYKDWDEISAFIFSLMISLFAFACIVGATATVYTHHHFETQYEYEVSIDDSVKFNDIFNNYDIIEQRGEIYTIREKLNKN